MLSEFKRIRQVAFIACGDLVPACSIVEPLFKKHLSKATLKDAMKIKHVPGDMVWLVRAFARFTENKEIAQYFNGLLSRGIIERPDSVSLNCDWTFTWTRNPNLEVSCDLEPNNKIEDSYRYSATFSIWPYGDGNYGWADGIESCIEDAAERCYVNFLYGLTYYKFQHAMRPRIGREIEIHGNWLPADCTYTAIRADDRSDQVFALGAPLLRKDTFVTTITSFRGTGINPLDYKIETPEITLLYSMDWNIHRPQQYVRGITLCKVCERTSFRTDNYDMCYVRGHGPMCGPCRDHLEDNDQNIHAFMV